MVPENDWRLLSAKLLIGQKFRWKRYEQPSPKWDHDHCSGCWATFAEFEGPEILHEGYAVTEACEKGPDYYWVCAGCFEALKEQLEWSVVA